jgi:hypothetical protein
MLCPARMMASVATVMYITALLRVLLPLPPRGRRRRRGVAGSIVVLVPRCKRGNDHAGVSRFHRGICSSVSRTASAASLGSSNSGTATTALPYLLQSHRYRSDLNFESPIPRAYLKSLASS